MTRWILLLTTIVTMASCGTNNEGCLDANATNFNVSADKNCCCTYPQMGIRFEFYNGDAVLSSSNPLVDAGGDTISIQKLSFYVSDLHWILSNDEEKRSDKRLWLYLSPGNYNDSTRSIDDYYLIDAVNNVAKDFTFYTPFTLKKLRLTIGVADSALANQPRYMKNINHPLAARTDSMYDYKASVYQTLRLAYVPYKSNGLSDTIYVSSSQARQSFDLDVSFPTVLGFDNYVVIRMQVHRLIDGIRFREDSKQVISEKLAVNLKNILIP